MNYSKEETEKLIAEYQKSPSKETVARLAEELDRSTKSIIGKLSREGVYRREEYKTKTGEKPVTKLELVTIIADGLEMSPHDLEGLEKTPKPVLKKLSDAIAEHS